MPSHLPLVLIIRDGWGENPHPEHDAFNAVKLARTPVADALMAKWPRTLIATSGEDVGLPEGTMGNSEVGHQNIGAGRVVDQESVRITRACREGRLGEIEALTGPILRATRAGKAVHLLSIASDAGVHGLLTHLGAVLALCAELGQKAVVIHLFTDGRDTGPFAGRGFVDQVEVMCRDAGVGVIASVIGRYWAMDRDNRWERVQRAYACLTGRGGAGEREAVIAPTALAAVDRYYSAPMSETQQGDEFVTPTMIGQGRDGALAGRITDGDTVVFCNYRGDRPRELVSAFVLPEFDGSPQVKASPDTGRRGFDRGAKLDIDFVTMTAYSEALSPYVRVAFPKPPRMTNIAGDYLARLGLRQFRCAETEKYPHVTFFFNDYRDEPFEGETRDNPQSPRVATYDLKPEMAAYEVLDAVLRRLSSGAHCPDVLIVNFANGDMVGHTGNLKATVRACEVVDECVGRIVDATLTRGGGGGCLIVTADHGNAEQMWDPATNAAHTAHTTYDVPLIVVGGAFAGRSLRDGGRLADLMPTALDMMGIPIPAEMTGKSLLA